MQLKKINEKSQELIVNNLRLLFVLGRPLAMLVVEEGKPGRACRVPKVENKDVEEEIRKYLYSYFSKDDVAFLVQEEEMHLFAVPAML